MEKEEPLSSEGVRPEEPLLEAVGSQSLQFGLFAS